MKAIKVIVAETEYRLDQDGDQAWPDPPDAVSGTPHYGRRKGDVRQEPRDYGGG
jgi:hypothetical protein